VYSSTDSTSCGQWQKLSSLITSVSYLDLFHHVKQNLHLVYWQIVQTSLNLLVSLDQRILKTSTSIVTLVNSIEAQVKKLVIGDIAASKEFYTQLKDVYSQRTVFMARGFAEPMKLCASLMSQVHITMVNSVTIPGYSLTNEEKVKIGRLQVGRAKNDICI
jgi:hypothetical protein